MVVLILGELLPPLDAQLGEAVADLRSLHGVIGGVHSAACVQPCNDMVLRTEVGNFFIYLPYTLLIAACAVLHGFHLVNQRTEQFGSVGFQLDSHIGEYLIYDILTHMAVLTFGCTGRAAGAYPMRLAVYHLMSEDSAAFGTAQLSGQRIGLSFASFRFP